jgi:hypothetical protein
VANHIVEVIVFLQCFGGGKAGVELRLGVFLPQRDAAAVFVAGADGFAGRISKRHRCVD